MANNAIKGITVEIGGNTTKLTQAIGDSEKKTRSLQVELRQIDRLLQFDPTNVDLLTQKQGALRDAVEETSNKLTTLKEAEAQVIAQFERGEIAESQLRAFQREIIQTERDLSRMQTELTNTETAMRGIATGANNAETQTDEYADSVKEAKEELDDFKVKAGEAFDTLKVGVTAIGGATVATAGYASKLSNDFDKAFNTLIAKTGASADEMEALNTSMENVYASNFGESIEDVATSMATIKTATNLTGKELENVTKNALLMRDTFDFEVNESIRAVNSMMDQFGITADEAYNLLAQGAQKGLNQNDDLLDTINEYSIHFERAGYSADDMFNMLANGVETGTWSVDKLGDAVKEFNIRMSDGSAKDAVEALGFSWEGVSKSWSKGGDSAKEVFNMLFNELDGLEHTTEGYSIGVGLLGTMYEDLGQDAVLALSKTKGEISKTSDALNTINETKYDDIGSALQGLGRELEVGVIKPLGEELQPTIEEAIEYVKANAPAIKETLTNVVDKVGQFVNFVVDNGDYIVATIAGIASGLALWNVVSVITSVVNAIKAFKTANEGATVAQMLLNAVMNANPIGILVTVIGGIIVALATFIATNDDARAKFIEIWNKIKEVAGIVIDALVTFFTVTIPNAIQGMIDWFQSLGEKIGQAFEIVKATITAYFEIIKAVITAYVTAWKTVIITAWNVIKGAVTTAVELVKNIITVTFNNIKTTITTYVNLWKITITTAWNLIKTTVTTVVNGIKTTISSVFNIIKTTISTVMTTIKTTVTTVWNTIKSTVSSVVNGIKTVISSVFNAIKALLRGDMDAVKTHMSTAWDAIKTTVSSVVTGIKTVISTVFTGIKTTITTVINGIKDSITTVWTNIKTTTSEVFNGIKTTMSDAITTAKTTVVTACENVFTGMKNAFKNVKNTFKSVGTNVIDGVKSGITGAVGGLYDSIKEALGGLVDKAKDALGIHSPSKVFADIVGKQIPAGIAVGVDNNADIANKAVNDLTDDITAQTNDFNGATITRKLSTTFTADTSDFKANNEAMLSKLDSIYERLGRLQMVTDTGALVGEMLDKIDAGLASTQMLRERGV